MKKLILMLLATTSIHANQPQQKFPIQVNLVTIGMGVLVVVTGIYAVLFASQNQ